MYVCRGIHQGDLLLMRIQVTQSEHRFVIINRSVDKGVILNKCDINLIVRYLLMRKVNVQNLYQCLSTADPRDPDHGKKKKWV